ncbi:blastula protease 10-like [Gigantopelta aegis]|uniref:blastula protease 10-like n=1 Tax=Gigantopelta aegis TaxID=1735272 RepID=UPI001B88B6F0|nr:blastula protease 10-like [Gigantopelta aegis]
MISARTFFIFGAVFLCGLISADDPDSRNEYLLNSFFDVENGTYYKSKLTHAVKEEPEENQHSIGFTDDEILTSEQKHDFQQSLVTTNTVKENQKRKVVPHIKALWPNGIIPYKFSSNRMFYSLDSEKAVRQAMDHWEKYTCLQFLGTIVHELGHVIGFYHEHARSDRDQFVRIIANNIKYAYRFNFVKAKLSTNEAPYDLASDMHYGSKFFSKSGGNTIVAKDPFLQFLMGRRFGLSFYDIQEANKAYNCSAQCGGLPACKNGGFLLKDCTCHCPDGLVGVTCGEISRKQSKGNGYMHFLTYGRILHIITSPYPKTHALWFIKSPEGTTMELEVELDLSRSEHTHTCRHWVEIRYNLLGQEGPRFCGRSTETQTLIETSSNVLMIKYNGEIGDPIRRNGDGFSINVKVLGHINQHVRCTFSDADMDSCPFFQAPGSNNGFQRMAITLSWLKSHNKVMDESSRAYLYIDSKQKKPGSKATCTSAQIEGIYFHYTK